MSLDERIILTGIMARYQVTLDIALLWSADVARNRVLLTSHSSGVKPFYEETLIQSSSLSESWVSLDEEIIPPRIMCAIDKTSGQENLYGSSIAFVIHSLDHSLSVRLIPSYMEM